MLFLLTVFAPFMEAICKGILRAAVEEAYAVVADKNWI
jgi:hypothetical protein